MSPKIGQLRNIIQTSNNSYKKCKNIPSFICLVLENDWKLIGIRMITKEFVISKRKRILFWEKYSNKNNSNFASRNSIFSYYQKTIKKIIYFPIAFSVCFLSRRFKIVFCYVHLYLKNFMWKNISVSREKAKSDKNNIFLVFKVYKLWVDVAVVA